MDGLPIPNSSIFFTKLASEYRGGGSVKCCSSFNLSMLISSADNKINFRASGSVVKFDGFLKVYQVQETDEDVKNILPEVKVGEEINILKLNDEQHFTDPPPRYS